MASSLELIEEKFRRVEEASERRALDESGVSRSELAGPSTKPGKCRKKPSVSVSRFGKATQDEGGDDGLYSPSPSPLSAAASKSTFYHTHANPMSVDSFASEKSEGGIGHSEEYQIQVQRITGRQTLPRGVGVLLPRRLTRARSQLDYVSVDKNMVIDVSIETTTESIRLSPDLDVSTIDATRPLRSRAATVGISTPQSTLVGRAKDFASKLRRKSRG